MSLAPLARPAIDAAGERLFELSHDLLCVVRASGEIVRVNPAFERMLGRTADALVGHAFVGLVHPDDRAATTAALESVVAGSPPETVENRYRCTDGSWRWLSWLSSSPDEHGLIYAIGRDITEWRLRDARLRFQSTLLDAVGQAIIATDVDGTVTYWGRAAAALYGWSADEALGHSVVDLTSAGPSREQADAIMAVLREGQTWSGELMVRRRDGTDFMALVVDTPVLDDFGALVGLVGASMDVSAPRRVADALEASEARYRAALAQASDAIYIVDDDGRFLFANEALCRLLDYTRAQLDGFRLGDFVAPEDLARLSLQLEQLRSGGLVVVERDLRRRDGSFVTTEISSRMLDNGTFQGIARDITERRRAEAALRASDARLRLALDAAGMIVWERDLDTGRLLDGKLPPGAKDGGAGSATGGQALPDYASFLAMVHPDDRERVASADAAAVACGGELDIEYRVSTPNGADRWHHTSARVTPGPKGEPWRLIGVSTDVTARVALEAQLRQSQKMEAVGRLAGGVAHDFNNLLQVITGNTLFARERLPADSPAREELAEVDAAAGRAAALTRQLLAFSRQQVLRPELVSVNRVVTNVERMLRRLVSADIVLVTTLEPDLALVFADAGQLEQVLLNLAVNACDAMPSGGTLAIETDHVLLDVAAAARAADLAPGPYVAMRVRDTGLGMDAATQAQLFEPFFTTKGLGKGTGLGLASVYGIVKQSGGHVRIDTTPGEGSTFTVLLPAVEGVAVVAEPDGPRHLPRGGETILVVEDEPAVRALIRRMLEWGGYTVIEAAHGGEALARLADPTLVVDLVLSDLVMPEMGAGALLARLRERKTPVKVLLVSGYSHESALRQPGSGWDAELLAKPFTADELLRRVRAVLDAPSTA